VGGTQQPPDRSVLWLGNKDAQICLMIVSNEFEADARRAMNEASPQGWKEAVQRGEERLGTSLPWSWDHSVEVAVGM
jgi:hypothetical protein